MKTKLFFFMKNAICTLLLCFPILLFSQIQNNFYLPSNFICEYQDDVKALSVELMLASNTADTNSVSIIPTYENEIWKGLATIINDGNADFVDIIFNQACVKKRYTNSILFIYNPNAEWIQEWKIDNETVNNTEVASLLNNYAYQVSFFSNNNPFAALNFKEILNLKPLIAQLSKVEDFEFVRSEELIGDGNNISITKNDNILTFLFKLGWNVCPTGCINNRFYKFEIDVKTCTVLSEITYGDSGFGDVSFCNILNTNKNLLNLLYKSMEFQHKPIANFGKNVTVKANGFEFKSDESNLPPLEPIHPKVKPGYSYFWNFGDGNYAITVDKPEGFTNHIYKKNRVYNVSVERTKIKTDPKFANEIERNTQMIIIDTLETPADWNYSKTKISNGKNVELINVRDAVPGVPFTLISSFKNSIPQIPWRSTVLLSYPSDKLLLSYHELPYCEELEEAEIGSTDNTLRLEANNMAANEQRNFFSYFQVNPKIEPGEEIKVCLTYIANSMSDRVCETYIVGKSHDPSYKKFIDPNCFINDSLEFLIHLENDGNKQTELVVVTDSLVPPLIIDTIDWKGETDCHLFNGTDALSQSEEQVIFTFDPMNLRGTNESGYLKDFGYEAIKDEFTFKMKLDNPLLSLTGEIYLCNEAEVFFDDNPAYPISDCFFCLLNEFENVPKKKYCTFTYLTPNVQSKQIPKILCPNPTTVNKGENITIEPVFDGLPEVPDFNFIWWPGQETTDTITVNPVEDELYRLLTYWEMNDTIFYVEDEIVIRVNSCELESAVDTMVKQLTCYGANEASIEISVLEDGDYSIFWEDVNDKIYGDQVFVRNDLKAGIYTYTLVNNSSCCEKTESITIEEKTPLTILIEKQRLDNGTFMLEAFFYGGEPPYQYKWFSETETFSGVTQIGPLSNLNYTFEVTDENDCTIEKLALPSIGNFNCEE